MKNWLTRCFAMLLLVLPFVPVVADDPHVADRGQYYWQLAMRPNLGSSS